MAWAASIAHWNDVGGKTPGSMAVDVSEIFQEGLRLPAVKLFENGKPIASVFDIISANSRLPDFVRGDLWAQIAASRKAETRIRQLVATYGLDAYRIAIASLFVEGERRGRAGLAALPHGTFRIEEEQDDGAMWRAADQHLTRALHGRPLWQPEAARRALQHQPRRRGDLLPDDLQGADRPVAVCQCRARSGRST